MTHVVVAGAGLAGIACAHELGKKGLDVTIVDRNDYHQFQPLLYQVATSQLPAEDIARPLASIFESMKSVRVVKAEITEVNFNDRSLVADGERISGDHLVLAAGATANFFGTPGAEEYSFPLYSVADAETLRHHVSDLLRGERDPLDVVIVGGGPTGVETAGAFAELFTALRKMNHPGGRGEAWLINHGPALLAPYSDRSHKYAHDKLVEHGAKVRLGIGVKAVDAEGVLLSDGSRISSRTVIWAGGESASPIASTCRAELGHGGRIDVLADLTVPTFENVYAVGDVANIPGADGKTLPQLGSVAQQAGGWTARNILLTIKGKPRKTFAYRDKGIMAMIGRGAAVAEVGEHRHQVEGPLAFAAWLGVHAALLSGAHSRVDAFLSWAWDYFDSDHSAIVECHGNPKRIAWADDVKPTI
ncbi:MAG: NAD(P)/FAD-dependent oxidoreductase [Rhodococcus sp. (in: high G+C Gram-positive bacteria)]|uniref:NAD(P)/FAD-dependent oxidoreductase n=1 Tax=Rhodococcus sp. EPR-157 TaxID=1813677 RepID=UPI0007BBE451|nr:NAD(P)/FAD-dependent oxidoreductase [Rhodococcus sp. EPR-157]KZF04032.1 NADH dehydrogenase [Rhodococcus sp. EPR-157]